MRVNGYSIDEKRLSVKRPDGTELVSTGLADFDIQAIGDRIKAVRAITGITGRDIARQCRLEPQTISNITVGRNATQIKTIFGIARALGADPMWLLFGPDGPGIPPNEDGMPNKVSGRLALARKYRGYSQSQFASDFLQISQGSYSRWENGTRRLSDEEIDVLAECLNVKEDWLKDGEGPMIEGEAVPAPVVGSVEGLEDAEGVDPEGF